MPSVTGNDSIDAVRHDNFAVIKTEVMLSVEVLDAIVPCPAIGLNTLQKQQRKSGPGSCPSVNTSFGETETFWAFGIPAGRETTPY